MKHRFPNASEKFKEKARAMFKDSKTGKLHGSEEYSDGKYRKTFGGGGPSSGATKDSKHRLDLKRKALENKK